MLEKIKKFWKSVWEYLKYLWKNPKTTLPAFCVAEIIFWMPVWIPFLLGLIINPWWYTIAIGTIVFWAGPITPAIGCQIAFIVAVERLFNKIKKRKEKKKNE